MGRWTWTQAHELAILVEVNASSERPFDHHLRVVWDQLDHQEPLIAAGFRPEEIKRVRDAFLASYGLTIEDIEDMTFQVNVFNEHHDLVVSCIRDMLSEVLRRLPLVSGDDEYYDYYPDMFSIMDQIVFNAGQAMPADRAMLEAMLNVTRQIAVDIRYYDPAEVAWTLVNADQGYIDIRDRKIRHGWLEMVQDDHGKMVWRYTQKYLADNDLEGLQLPEWVVRP